MTVGTPEVLLVRRAVGDDQPALTQYVGPTGKPGAVKVARPVWSGGKAVKPYLSLPFAIRRQREGCSMYRHRALVVRGTGEIFACWLAHPICKNSRSQLFS